MNYMQISKAYILLVVDSKKNQGSVFSFSVCFYPYIIYLHSKAVRVIRSCRRPGFRQFQQFATFVVHSKETPLHLATALGDGHEASAESNPPGFIFRGRNHLML